MIHVTALQHSFGDFQLSIDSLSLPTGAYGVLLGPSGAGKSLLLKMIAGLTKPQQGQVLFDGQDMTFAPIQQRRTGLVFQEPSLFPHLSVRDNIAYGLKKRGILPAERKKRVDQLIEQFDLASLVVRPTTKLSGGEAQKVVLVRALAVRPHVLLLDEPLSQVDHQQRRRLQQLLKDVRRDWGLSCLHVTHDRKEAQAMATFCAVMVGGRVIQQGRYQDLQEQPRCAFVARFVGADESNLGNRYRIQCGETCLSRSVCDGQLGADVGDIPNG